MVNCIGIIDMISFMISFPWYVLEKNGSIFLQNLFSVFTKCPDESPIVLQKRHKTTKIGAHRPAPATKHAVEGLASGLKWQFTPWSPSGNPYFCCEKGMSAAM